MHFPHRRLAFATRRRFAMQLPAIPLEVTLLTTVVACDLGFPRGITSGRLRHVAKHHGSRSLVARVAVLTDIAPILLVGMGRSLVE